MRKWRSFKIGQWQGSVYQRRSLHVGIGYKLGCGHNIVGIYHCITKDGVEVWSKLVKYEVTFDA